MQIRRGAKVKLNTGKLTLEQRQLSRHIVLCVRGGQQQCRQHDYPCGTGLNHLTHRIVDRWQSEFQKPVGNGLPRYLPLHQCEQRLDLPQCLRIATPVRSDNDAVVHSSTHEARSIWLGIGRRLRSNMILMSVKSPVQSCNVPAHRASRLVRFSQTSTGCSAATPNDSRNAATSLGMKSHGRGMTMALRTTTKTNTRRRKNGSRSPRR